MDRPIGRDLVLDSVEETNEFEVAVALQRQPQTVRLDQIR